MQRGVTAVVLCLAVSLVLGSGVTAAVAAGPPVSEAPETRLDYPESVPDVAGPSPQQREYRHDSPFQGGAVETLSRADGSVPVVVFFESFAARRNASLAAYGANVTGGREVDFAPVLFATVNETSLPELRESRFVESVAIDRRVRTPAEISTPETAVRRSGTQQSSQIVPWNVEQIGALRPGRTVPRAAQNNVSVAVLDTGIDTTHEDIDGNLAWGASVTYGTYRPGLEAADDENGHGTAAAGIIGAEDNAQGIRGIAPNTRLYAIQVLDSWGRGRISWAIRGIDVAIKGPDGQIGTQDDADVLSMSFGSTSSTARFAYAIHWANEHAVVVSAAGNSGDGNATTNEIEYPAKYPDSIAVGAVNSTNATPVFSAEGAEIELAAPGLNVPTLRATGGIVSFGGTSAAAPHVAAAAALVLASDLADGNRTLSSQEIRQRLRSTARDMGPPGRDNRTGYGLIQVDEAVMDTETPTLPAIVREYDTDNDGQIGIQELGAAAADYVQDEITLSELSKVSTVYAQ